MAKNTDTIRHTPAGEELAQQHEEEAIWQAVLQEVARVASNDIVLQSGWQSLVAWLLVDPARQPVDKLIPEFGMLLPKQKEAIKAIYQIPAWGDLTHWQQEAYRQGFDRQLGFVLRLVEANLRQRMQEYRTALSRASQRDERMHEDDYGR